MTISIFLLQTNLRFSVRLFASCKVPISGEPLAPLLDAEKMKLCKLPSTRRERGDTESWRVTPWTVFLLRADRTSRRGNPCTDKVCHLTRFLKDASCPLSGEGNWTSLFHGERMSTCEMRQMCVSPLLCVRDAFVCAWQWQTADQRGGWLMPALSDWQRKTHHRSSALVINSVCLLLKVEAASACRMQKLPFKSCIAQWCFLKLVIVAWWKGNGNGLPCPTWRSKPKLFFSY